MYEVSTIFKNDKFGEFRTIINEDGETLFVAVDVCKALGYTNPTKALQDNVDELDRFNITGISMLNVKTNKGYPTNFVNVYGMLALILGSKIPSAREFRYWVIHEVLPEIFTKGYYAMPSEIEEQYIDHVTVTEDCKDGLEFAAFLSNKGFDIGRNQLFEWLRENNYLMSKGCHYNKPYREYIKRGYFKVGKVNIINPDGTVIKKDKVCFTYAGRLYFFNKLTNRKKGIPMKYSTTLF